MLEEFLKAHGEYYNDKYFKELTTIKMGGHIKHFVLPYSVKDVKEIVAYLKEKHIPFKVLGNGSNLICGESEFAGLALVRDENNYSVFGITYKKGRKTSVVATIVDGKRIIEGEAPISSLDVITLRIVGENTQLRFQLVDGPKITDVCTTSALHLSTQTVSPVGVLASMYCTSCWKEDEE